MHLMTNKILITRQPLVYFTRIETFDSAHRLNSGQLDGQTNRETFGKCNTIHGHNYRVELTVKGTADPVTGILCNNYVLKEIMSDTILKPFDHKFIDEDVSYFRDDSHTSTLENIVIYIWKAVSDRLPTNVRLHQIKLYSTEKNVVTFSGEFE
ncbi:6-pyruvoyl tetrahydrobiopterin synthase-like [Oppia nitens]|uniref:6-pyruvoyl tetrahydrobiopterin synthase-like n=1 Tax=Oppia nitens TaxID=1686743 RepID=UPI0023DB65B1|nr:6-pyruvoyl tetrahydrobiopterin synthase-like [Oppia nitens]